MADTNINIYHKAEVDKTTIDFNEQSKLHTVHPYYRAVTIRVPASQFAHLEGYNTTMTFEVPKEFWNKVCRFSVSQRKGKWAASDSGFVVVGKYKQMLLTIEPTNQDNSTGDDLYVLIEELPVSSKEIIEYELHTTEDEPQITIIRPVGSTALIDFWNSEG